MGKFDGSSSSHIGGVSSIIKFIQDQIDLINIKLNSLSITPILEKISNFPFGTSGKANKNINMDSNLLKNLGDPISEKDSTNKKYVDNLTNTNETRSKHNFSNILTLFSRTKKMNTDGDFILNLDMNNKNIKNIKIDRINNNSVSTIGYTNEKIEKPGTDIDMQELNSIINLKDIDNSSKDGYATNKKYVDTKTNPINLIKNTGGIDDGTIQLDNNIKLKVNLSDDFSVDSITGSIKIKNTNTNNFIEPLEVENNNVKLNYGYGLGIKNSGYGVETKKNLDVILYSDGGLKFLPAAEGNFGLSLDFNSHDFKIENSKLKLNYGYGLGIEDDLINLGKTLNVVVDPLNCISYKKIDYKLDGKDISSYGLYIKNGKGLKINNDDKKIELDLNPYKGLQFYNDNQLGLKANISEFIGLENNSGLKVSTETQKLSIDIDPLKAMLYNVLGSNLIYDPTTKKLNAKENDFIYFFRGKSLIEDHSITYLNLQDKSGMKFDSKNNVTEIMNYRNKLFEYKSDHFDHTYHTSYIVNNKNPNESHLEIINGYFESNIIEDYRVIVFIVIKNNKDQFFILYDNSDHSLKLLKIEYSIGISIGIHNPNNYYISFTTINMNTSTIITTNIHINKKILICVSWNGVNSAAYINGKKKYTFTHSGVGTTTSGIHKFDTPNDGELYEFIIFNSLLLNDEKIKSINKYLADKHDITFEE